MTQNQYTLYCAFLLEVGYGRVGGGGGGGVAGGEAAGCLMRCGAGSTESKLSKL